MDNKQSIGKLGEDLACDYLQHHNCRIIDRNFRKPWGEIDIIAKDKNRVLIFVEVKTIRQRGNQLPDIVPEDNLTNSKLKKLQRTASLYVGQNEHMVDEEKGWRIDLIAITLTNELKNCDIQYFENI